MGRGGEKVEKDMGKKGMDKMNDKGCGQYKLSHMPDEELRKWGKAYGLSASATADRLDLLKSMVSFLQCDFHFKVIVNFY